MSVLSTTAKPEPTLRDARGWKIMKLGPGNQVVRSYWGEGEYQKSDSWYHAKTIGYGWSGWSAEADLKYTEPYPSPYFGFHAYATRDMARRALREYKSRGRDVVLVRVTLGDVFLRGQDNTFGTLEEDQLTVLVARAMKVEEIYARRG